MRMIFMGTPDFAVPSLKALVRVGHLPIAVITQPDRPRGRGKHFQPTPIKAAALAMDLPVWQPATLKEPGLVDRMRTCQPEVIVVVAYGKILPPAVLGLPPRGCINVHASLLPRYRGAAPIHRAVMEGTLETGITTMYMDRGMDTGDMILQRPLAIRPDDTVGDVHDHLAGLGADLLVETLDLLARGEAPRLPQKNQQSTYAPPLTRDDEMIRWDRPAREIINQIRGMNPWPGARTNWGERVLKIWHAELGGQVPAGVMPGEVLKASIDRGLLVATGEESIWLTEVQVQGGRPLPAADFLRGRPIPPGTILS